MPLPLVPPDLQAWLDSIDVTDASLRRFAADVALVVAHGLAPRVAVAAILRAVIDGT